MPTLSRRVIFAAIGVTAVAAIIVGVSLRVKRNIDASNAINRHHVWSSWTLRAVYDRFKLFESLYGHYPSSDAELEVARDLAWKYWPPLEHEVPVVILFDCISAGRADLLAIAPAHPHRAERYPGVGPGEGAWFNDLRLGVWSDGTVRPLSLDDLLPLSDCLPEGMLGDDVVLGN